MHFLFLNQYAPPDPAPTGRLLGELANFLRTRGHTVEIVSQSQGYHQRPAHGGSRLRRELAALWAIARAGLPRRRGTDKRLRVDVVLAMTSPPGLLAVAALLAVWHRAALAHWAMDLYPELALELGEIGPGLPYRVTRAAMSWGYRRCALIVVLDEDMQSHLRRAYGVESRVLPPWPSEQVVRALDELGEASPPGSGEWVWLYSGNLGRAHEWETLLETQALLEARNLPVKLVLQGDGAARPAAELHAAKLGLRRCVWKGYAPEEELLANLLEARLLIVTQRPVVSGLLWPSKLAVIERLPRPVLWIGPTDGAIASRLRSRGDTGIFAPGQSAEAARWIEAYHHAPAGPIPPSPNTAVAHDCSLLSGWLTALRN